MNPVSHLFCSFWISLTPVKISRLGSTDLHTSDLQGWPPLLQTPPSLLMEHDLICQSARHYCCTPHHCIAGLHFHILLCHSCYSNNLLQIPWRNTTTSTRAQCGCFRCSLYIEVLQNYFPQLVLVQSASGMTSSYQHRYFICTNCLSTPHALKKKKNSPDYLFAISFQFLIQYLQHPPSVLFPLVFLIHHLLKVILPPTQDTPACLQSLLTCYLVYLYLPNLLSTLCLSLLQSLWSPRPFLILPSS